MQSKRSKAFFILILAIMGCLITAAMLHEPKLVQTQVEQGLDAGKFNQ